MKIVVGKRIKIPRIFIKRADSRRERGRTKGGNQAPRAFPAAWKTDVAFGRVHIWRNRIPVAVAVGFAYCRTTPALTAPPRSYDGERETERESDRLKRGSLGVQSANPSSWPPNSCTRVLAFTWKSRSGTGLLSGRLHSAHYDVSSFVLTSLKNPRNLMHCSLFLRRSAAACRSISRDLCSSVLLLFRRATLSLLRDISREFWLSPSPRSCFSFIFILALIVSDSLRIRRARVLFNGWKEKISRFFLFLSFLFLFYFGFLRVLLLLSLF